MFRVAVPAAGAEAKPGDADGTTGLHRMALVHQRAMGAQACIVERDRAGVGDRHEDFGPVRCMISVERSTIDASSGSSALFDKRRLSTEEWASARAQTMSDQDDVLNETKSKMKAAIAAYEQDLQGIRGGRASTALVDRLPVEYYGQDTELRQLATISTPEPMQILIRPYDKSAVKSIEKAIRTSDLNLNPQTDGDAIRLNMPALTRERRQELVKFLSKRTEEGRIAVRNIRRHMNDDVKEFEKEKLISEDDAKHLEAEIQKLTDKTIEQMEEMAKHKEKEILEV
jgi:ribosome recycling factor